ncbi:GDSL-type esterase/lipase family protein [Ruminococcus sp. XPD3002]|uniref:GDSL-type esterase/lipase family protein n=1 Tax=Ruminococcus sp. XPD3002 TaxID=1452269 RepID=UPI000912464B|nr:Lysophospholipase L1 [Ruminococcus flavefaciens]
MNKGKQYIYTFLLLITCFVASPFMWHKIWKTSADAKKEPAVPVSANVTPTAPAGEVPAATEASTEGSAQPAVNYTAGSVSYFDDALFIGDSRMVGISEYGSLKNADYFCSEGLQASRIATEAVDGKTVDDVLNSKTYGKVYVMLGINEVGNDMDTTISKYSALVNDIKAKQPQAIIYLLANLHVSSFVEDGIINNGNIDTLNSRIAQLADYSTTYYLDVNSVFDDGYGGLNAEYTSDGIHPLAKYYGEWSDWLCANTVSKDGQAAAPEQAEVPQDNAAEATTPFAADAPQEAAAETVTTAAANSNSSGSNDYFSEY